MDWPPLRRLTRARPMPGSPWRFGWGTLSLVLTILAVYGVQMYEAAQHGMLHEFLWEGENEVPGFALLHVGPLWTEYPVLLIPHAFAHGVLVDHLLVNLVGIVLGAPAIEGRTSGWRVWSLFIVFGVVTGATQASLSQTWSWGASGSAAAFLVAWLLLDLRATAGWVWSYRTRLPTRAVDWLDERATNLTSPTGWRVLGGVLVGAIALDTLSKVGSNDGVGHVAHLTGFLLGLPLVWFLLHGVPGRRATGDPDPR